MDSHINLTKIIQNATNATESSVGVESGILFSTLSVATFTLATILLYDYSKGDERSLGTPTNCGILFFGGLVTFIADLLFHDHSTKQYFVYLLCKVICFGIFVTLFGAKTFFVSPVREDQLTVGSNHKSISLIVLIITVPLVLLEITASVAAFVDDFDVRYAIVNIVAIIQKIVQAVIYHYYLRFKAPAEKKRCGASWYFKILALFNFSMWIQSIIEAENESNIPMNESIPKEVLNIISSTYSALMIDYRLLCCLLFVEHAYEIDYEEDHKPTWSHGNSSELENSYPASQNLGRDFYVQALHMQRYGFLFGTILFVLQFLNALMYLDDIGPWVNIFGFLAELSVLMQGFVLIQQVRPSAQRKGKWRETNSKGVDLMVAMMGVTGFAFWILKSVLLAVWSVKLSGTSLSNEVISLNWLAAKSFFRSFICIFQIYLYIRADPSLGCRPRIKHNRLNHFLLPSLILSFLSVFVNSVIDSFHKFVKVLVKASRMHIVLYAFYEAGIPIHLGFCLHLFIHYLLIYHKMNDSLAAENKRYNIDDVTYNHNEDQRNLLENNDGDAHEKYEQLLGNGRKFRSV